MKGLRSRILFELGAGKLFVNLRESKMTHIFLPAGLAAAAGRTPPRWILSAKNASLLVEATKDGSAAAITVIEDAIGKGSSVKVWESDDAKRVFLVKGGERLTLKAGALPLKATINLPQDLSEQIRNPFDSPHKWWNLPPATNESLAALTTLQPIKKPVGNDCPICGRINEPDHKFCIYCGTKMEPAKKQPLEKPGKGGAEKCANCGEPIRPGKKFCLKCGTKYATTSEEKQNTSTDPLRCTKCGEPIRPGKKFCMKCGTAQMRSN